MSDANGFRRVRIVEGSACSNARCFGRSGSFA